MKRRSREHDEMIREDEKRFQMLEKLLKEIGIYLRK
jgi:hypothetical protein